jgi:FG-GAP-like repeat/FG-GAP repeat
MTSDTPRPAAPTRRRRRGLLVAALGLAVGALLAACQPVQPPAPNLLPPVPPPNLPAPPGAPGPGAVNLNLVHQYQAGYGVFYQPGTHEAFSNPAVGIIDTSGGPSIVVGGMDGHLRAWHLDGTVVLDQNIDSSAIQASPVLYDMNGDGVLDVVVATTGGTIAVLQPTQMNAPGYAAWQFAVSDTPRPNGLRGFFATPAVADLDRDGVPEIIASSWDHHLWAWHRGGAVVAGFPYFLQDTSWSSVAVTDLDGDGYPEIVVGGDMDSFPGAPYPAGGLIWAFWGNGKPMPGFPISLPGQTIWSSPAIGDLNGDGRKDIVVGTGLNWPDPQGRFIYAFDMSSRPLSGWPARTSGRMMSSPAIADIEGNGHPDVVALMEDGKVIAFRPDGQFLWATCNIDNTSACRPGYGVHGSVSIADVNHDGVQDVVNMAENWMRVLDGHTGAIKAQYAVANSWAPASPPTIAQLQGTTWIIQAFTLETNHDGTPGVGDTGAVWAWSTGQTLGTADWPMFKQNNARTR